MTLVRAKLYGEDDVPPPENVTISEADRDRLDAHDEKVIISATSLIEFLFLPDSKVYLYIDGPRWLVDTSKKIEAKMDDVVELSCSWGDHISTSAAPEGKLGQ